MYRDIIINKEDVIPYVYFVCSLSQRGKMYGGLTGKNDYMGGIFDRWINIIPESVIFNKYLLPKIDKKLKVISDYYEYNPKKTGIAPDVLGVVISGKIIPFVEYVDKWCAIKNAPQIEVKSFKKGQYMVSLRDQGYDNKYLVLVETSLDSDYLLPFFETSITSDEIYEQLRMNDAVFVKKNQESALTSVTKISRNNTSLGTLKLITVCSAKIFIGYSNLCLAHESPVYLKSISKTRTPKDINGTTLSEYFLKNEQGLYSCKTNLLNERVDHKILDLQIENISNITIIKNSKSSITIYARGDAVINNIKLNEGNAYILKFQLLDRSSNKGSEYFINKSIIDVIPNQEDELLACIKDFILEH